MHQVVNRLSMGSLGMDSLVGSVAPPPGYTSQFDTASTIAVINDDVEEDALLKNSTPPPSMELPIHTLPSPYSMENLRSQDQNPMHSLHHGYTQTHGQSTPVRPGSYYPSQQQRQQQSDTRPLSCDTFYSPPHILSTDTLFSATNEQPRPYYQYSTDEHGQLPVRVDNQRQHQQATSPYSLPTSPYHPPPLRVLSYTSTDEGHNGCKEYSNKDEGNQSSTINDQTIMMMMMDSTATILSPTEEPLGHQSTHDLTPRRRLPSLPNGPTRQATIATDSTKSSTTKSATKKKKMKKSPTAKSSVKSHLTTPPPLPPTQSQPTNYVYISRKCNPSIPILKSRGWRRKTEHPNTQIPPPPPKLVSSSSSSAITGTFTINPELHIPPSLLNAMEDPVFFRFKPSSDTGETRERKRTNLRLEVENGAIDVDIHLVPTTTTISSDVGEDATCTGNRGGQQQDTSFCDTPVQALASVSTSTTAFGGPPISMQENLSGGTSRRGISTPEVSQLQHTSSPTCRRDKKKPSRPPTTTIDLRIKQTYHHHQQQQQQQNQDSDAPIVLPLIARIHAPNPRPPFHLFASTINIPTTNPIQTTDSTNSHPKEPHTCNNQQSRRASISNRPTISIQSSQVFSERSSIIVNNNSPPATTTHRTKRSLSKYRPQSANATLSSHGYYRGIIPTTGTASQRPPSSLSQLNLASSPPSSLSPSSPSSPPSSSSSSSPLYLHLPRTFRGPLTIHISSGHISDRLRLSEGLEREVALIRESEFSRGYFVGGLGWDNGMGVADNRKKKKKRVQVQVQDEDDGGEEEEIGVGVGVGDGVNLGATRDQTERMKKKSQQQLGNNNNPNKANLVDESSELSSSSVSSSISSSSSPGSSPGLSPSAWKGGGGGVQGDWYGDRIEILVGSGDVYLQYEDENEEGDDDYDNPFFRSRGLKREAGFWKRFFSYPGFLLL